MKGILDNFKLPAFGVKPIVTIKTDKLAKVGGTTAVAGSTDGTVGSTDDAVGSTDGAVGSTDKKKDFTDKKKDSTEKEGDVSQPSGGGSIKDVSGLKEVKRKLFNVSYLVTFSSHLIRIDLNKLI